MKCPGCKRDTLFPSYIDGLFRAHTCSVCEGNWILIEDYVVWKQKNPEYEFSETADFQYEDSKNALLCPITGAIMQKFKLTHDSEHRLDYSPQVGGVWLDKGEWEFLKQENLAGCLNAIFTSQWQKTIRENSAKVSFAEIYQEKFGEESYAQIKETRKWLDEHPCKADLIAYLMAEDPYSAER